MNKISLPVTVLFSLLVSLSAWAGPISERQALAIAANFMSARSSVSLNVRMAYSQPRLNPSVTGSGGAAYYVFNTSAPLGGYVIVAGDDRTPAVLGYSDGGTFDATAIPPAMQEMLEGYAAQIEALDTGCKAARFAQPGAAIAPLISASWSQNAPYNIKLPYLSTGKHAYVGCVATAMAQVMYYHKWPKRPTQALPAYTSKTLSISMPELPVVDFDWESMHDTYQTSDTTSASALAAATLSLYCAQSVNMDFKTASSGATTSYAPLALATYFGYSPAMRTLSRANYTTQEWADIIYSELAASRPVIYSGSKASSGHAFICDGYDGNGMFHINWGWNGQSNGYFLLNVLNPDVQGTGSATGAYGYIYRQGAIVGIEPDGGAASVFELTASDVALNASVGTRTSSSGTFSATVSGRFNNYTSQVMAVDFGWGLYQDDTMISKLYSGYNSALKPGSYLSSSSRTLTFGSGITSGTYRILPIYSERSANSWRPCAGADKNYIEVTISGNQCSFTGNGTAGEQNYTVDDILVEGNMHPNRPVDITLTLTNRGVSGNELLYMFVDGTFTSTGYVSLVEGETGEIPYRYMPTEAGTYTLTFSLNEDGSNPIATHVITINEMPEAKLSAIPTLLNVTDATNKVVTANTFSVELAITNDGTADYDEDISVKLFKNLYGGTGTNVQALNRRVAIAAGETVTLRFDLDNVTDGWKYFARAYYYSAGNQTELARFSTHTIVFPEEPQFKPGDVNNDGHVDVSDVTLLISFILGNEAEINQLAADVTGEGHIDVSDVTAIINIILGN